MKFKKSSHRIYVSHKGCQQFHHTVTAKYPRSSYNTGTLFRNSQLSQLLQRQDTFPPSTNLLLSTVSQQLASCLLLKLSTIKTFQNAGTLTVKADFFSFFFLFGYLLCIGSSLHCYQARIGQYFMTIGFLNRKVKVSHF